MLDGSELGEANMIHILKSKIEIYIKSFVQLVINSIDYNQEHNLQNMQKEEHFKIEDLDEWSRTFAKDYLQASDEEKQYLLRFKNRLNPGTGFAWSGTSFRVSFLFIYGH